MTSFKNAMSLRINHLRMPLKLHSLIICILCLMRELLESGEFLVDLAITEDVEIDEI